MPQPAHKPDLSWYLHEWYKDPWLWLIVITAVLVVYGTRPDTGPDAAGFVPIPPLDLTAH